MLVNVLSRRHVPFTLCKRVSLHVGPLQMWSCMQLFIPSTDYDYAIKSNILINGYCINSWGKRSIIFNTCFYEQHLLYVDRVEALVTMNITEVVFTR